MWKTKIDILVICVFDRGQNICVHSIFSYFDTSILCLCLTYPSLQRNYLVPNYLDIIRPQMGFETNFKQHQHSTLQEFEWVFNFFRNINHQPISRIPIVSNIQTKFVQ